MFSFNSADDLWRSGRANGTRRDGATPLLALSPVASADQSQTPDEPDVPVCCWNLCNGVAGRKTPRPLSAYLTGQP